MSDRFHQAAKDGYADLLKQATRKDLNQRDDSGMTPTLWAAYHGNLDALRLCCSRGGDPDKCDYTGNTALHFVSANGHINCLMFLVSFGANIWQMDNDYHTIMDVAAIREKQDCVKYLDGVIVKQKSLDKKKVQSLQVRAKKDAEKRIKLYEKMQVDQQKKLSKIYQASDTPTSRESGGRKKKTSAAKMNGNTTFSQATSTQRKISKQMNTASSCPPSMDGDGFLVSEGGRRTVNSIAGVQSNVQSDVMFQRSETMSPASGIQDQSQAGPRRKMLRNVFPEQQARIPEYRPSETGSVFGTIALRTNFGLASSMNSAAMDAQRRESDDPDYPSTMREFNGAGVGSSLFSLPTGVEPYGQLPESDDEDFLNGLEEPSELDTFLASLDLADFSKIFKEQKMDMDVLLGCNEADLKELGLVMGPRKKIMSALNERKAALEDSAEMELTQF